MTALSHEELLRWEEQEAKEGHTERAMPGLSPTLHPDLATRLEFERWLSAHAQHAARVRDAQGDRYEVFNTRFKGIEDALTRLVASEEQRDALWLDILSFARDAEMRAYHAGRTVVFREVLSAVWDNERLFKTTLEEPDDESETGQ